MQTDTVTSKPGKHGTLHLFAAHYFDDEGRGFAITHTTPPAPVPGLDADWTPTPEALAINRARIAERINAKPHFHRWTA